MRRAHDAFGHRPAVTVVGERRDEQGFASLAQWAAKGSHLLELDLMFAPGDRLRVDVGPGWPLVAVAHAAWWAGVAVTLTGDAAAAVVDEARPAPAAGAFHDVLWVGDAVDGSPEGEVDGEAWAIAVQAFPDHPPPPRARAELPAIVVGEQVLTHAEVLAAGTSLVGDGGPLGVDAATELPPELLVVALAVRPLLTGRPTVVLRPGVERAAATGERVTTWA